MIRQLVQAPIPEKRPIITAGIGVLVSSLPEYGKKLNCLVGIPGL